MRLEEATRSGSERLNTKPSEPSRIQGQAEERPERGAPRELGRPEITTVATAESSGPRGKGPCRGDGRSGGGTLPP